MRHGTSLHVLCRALSDGNYKKIWKQNSIKFSKSTFYKFQIPFSNKFPRSGTRNIRLQIKFGLNRTKSVRDNKILHPYFSRKFALDI